MQHRMLFCEWHSTILQSANFQCYSTVLQSVDFNCYSTALHNVDYRSYSTVLQDVWWSNQDTAPTLSSLPVQHDCVLSGYSICHLYSCWLLLLKFSILVFNSTVLLKMSCQKSTIYSLQTVNSIINSTYAFLSLFTTFTYVFYVDCQFRTFVY